MVTGAATEVVVIGEWEFGGPCRSLAFTSSLESSFGSRCISRSEKELAMDVTATAEEAEKAMSDWEKNSVASERSVLLIIGWCCPTDCG